MTDENCQFSFLIAGSSAVVERIHLGGVLALDAATYAVSLICYFAVRKGKVIVKPRELPSHVTRDAWARYLDEPREEFTTSGTSAISCCSVFPGRFSSPGC